MQVDLSNNYFELFDLPLSFVVDQQALTGQFRLLQKNLHPDRFAGGSAAERRWSVQAASFVNEGYQTLGSPLRRAIYLLQLNDISIDEETDTRMAPEFLMEQMELRESLEAATAANEPFDALDKLTRQLSVASTSQSGEFAAAAERGDWDAARTVVRQWQFLDKLRREVSAAEERLDFETTGS